jgi:delta24(24(1))-sterol reductase
MSFCWGAVIGTATPIPYFYSVFFIVVLVHRVGRDFERYAQDRFALIVADTFFRCSVKYGRDWEQYCQVVPYKFIPGVY